MSDKQILAELKQAKAARDAAKEAMRAKRGEYGEAKQAHADACKVVEDILAELVGDVPPIMAAIAAKAAAPGANGPAALPKVPPASKRAKKERPDAKLAGLELPTAKEIIEDLVQSQKGESPVPALEVAPESTPAASNAKSAAEPNGEKPFWVTDDVDRELFHALARSPHNESWGELIFLGATNEAIRARLEKIWPRQRFFVPKSQSGGRHGYTIQIAGVIPNFWIGAYLGPTHRPTIHGPALIDRIRTLLEIPTPHQVAQRKAALREPKIAEKDHASRRA